MAVNLFIPLLNETPVLTIILTVISGLISSFSVKINHAALVNGAVNEGVDY